MKEGIKLDEEIKVIYHIFSEMGLFTLRCKITVSHITFTILSLNLCLKVVFLFHPVLWISLYIIYRLK